MRIEGISMPEIDAKIKAQIDGMSYEQMLRRWRFAPSGDTIFQGDVGDYFAEVMKAKKNKLPHDEQVRISKNIGWSR